MSVVVTDEVDQDIYLLQVDEKGQINLPLSVREKLSLEAGDALTMFRLGTLLILTAGGLEVPRLTQASARLVAEKGISLADLLQNLDRVKQELYAEKYGTNPVPGSTSSVS
jgi:AbrB family looped-hinge helix DNA binding protein